MDSERLADRMFYSALPVNNPIHFPDKEVQEAHWKRKDDQYEEYLNDLHRQQQDPEYIASYKRWLEETQPLF